MKYLLLFSVLLLASQLSLAQQTFKITEGELAFIHPEEGIFIKKNNVIFELKLDRISDYEEVSKGFKYELEDPTLEEIKRLKNDFSTVFASEIAKYNFRKLNSTKFRTNVSDAVNYQLMRVNNDFISIAVLKDSLQKLNNEYLLHYCILDFGHNRKIIYHQSGFIVPTKAKLNFMFSENSIGEAFQKYSAEYFKNFKAIDLHFRSYELELKRGFYKIDTLKNKKLLVKNIYNQIQIKTIFDSIQFNSFFIIGYKKSKIEIYNYAFKKLKLRDVSGYDLWDFYPGMQIIQNNQLRNINLVGTEFTNNDLSYNPSFNHYFPSNTVSVKISKEQNQFYLETDAVELLVRGMPVFETKFKILNSQDYESIQYLDEESSILLHSEMLNYEVQYPVLIYTKLKSGKYNLATMESLIDSKLVDASVSFNNSLPKNLDSISVVNNKIYLIERGGLFGYYPLNKEVKYKILENFQGNFARFELPIGQKGWLSKQGKEYLEKL